MSDPVAEFYRVGGLVAGAEKSQMFGKPCFKIERKAFTCFFQEAMVLN